MAGTLKALVKEHGWYTAPMKIGSITRNPDGTKSHPQFISNWIVKGLSELRDVFTDDRPYLLLTGTTSDVVAVDCDNKTTADILLALDSTNPYTIHPKGKEGVTLLYKYPKGVESLGKSFSNHKPPYDIDYLADNKGMYLPCKANKTKKPFSLDLSDLPTLPEMPESVIGFLTALNSKRNNAGSDYSDTVNTPSNIPKPSNIPEPTNNTYLTLQPLIGKMVAEGKPLEALLKIVTPNRLKEEMPELYKAQGYIAPSDIHKGGGSKYLLALSTILGGDESIKASEYSQAMTILNEHLKSPLTETRLSDTIIKPMLNSSEIDGRRIWRYNKNWQSKGLTVLDKNNNIMYVFIDSISMKPAIAIFTSGYERVHTSHSVADCVQTINLMAGLSLKADKLNQCLVAMPLVSDFLRPFGVYTSADGELLFNSAKRSKCLDIILQPTHYKELLEDAGKPEAILDFLSHIIPNEDQRDYFIRHLATKLTTFEISPVVFNFIGISGSGKDTMFDLLKMLAGGERYAPVVIAEDFLSQFNEYMEHAIFVLLSELSDSLGYGGISKAKGRLKAYTGSRSYLLNDKRISKSPKLHNASFLIASNDEAPPLADINDRRHVYIDTPVVLGSWKGIGKYGDKSNAIPNLVKQMAGEIELFAYYLGTKVRPLTATHYFTPPHKVKLMAGGADKYSVIGNKPLRLAQVLLNRDWTYLIRTVATLEDYDVSEMDLVAMHRGKLTANLAKAICSHWGLTPSTYELSKGLKKHSERYRIEGERVVAFSYDSLKDLDIDTLRTGFTGAEI